MKERRRLQWQRRPLGRIAQSTNGIQRRFLGVVIMERVNCHRAANKMTATAPLFASTRHNPIILFKYHSLSCQRQLKVTSHSIHSKAASFQYDHSSLPNGAIPPQWKQITRSWKRAKSLCINSLSIRAPFCRAPSCKAPSCKAPNCKAPSCKAP